MLSEHIAKLRNQIADLQRRLSVCKYGGENAAMEFERRGIAEQQAQEQIAALIAAIFEIETIILGSCDSYLVSRVQAVIAKAPT